MRFIDATLESPAANLACDEAFLDWCEAGHAEGILRFWESPTHFVTLGYANKADSEVYLDRCELDGIPVLRRCSGGGTVLQGPGCLNYSLVLPIDGSLEGITESNCFVMQRVRDGIQELVKEPVEIRGHTDLALNNLKFSGNAQRRRKRFLLFHGSFLLNFDLPLIDRLLKFPSREPNYREGRSHHEFLTLLKASAEQVKNRLRIHWLADRVLDPVPRAEIQRLVETRYSQPEWNLKW